MKCCDTNKQPKTCSLFSWMTENLDSVALNFGVVVGKSRYVFKITWTHCLKLRGKIMPKNQLEHNRNLHTDKM